MQSKKTKIVGWFLFGVCFLGVLLVPEIGTRIYVKLTIKQIGNPRYLEMSHSYPLLKQLIRDWSALQFGYHDYYVFSPLPKASETVNFTSYYGARATPDSVEQVAAKEIVWAFGGSTMQNLESDDRLTLANQIAAELNQRQTPTRVYNFGSGGFQSSLEIAKFQDLLRRVPQTEWPTTAIFYDGFNEANFGYYFGPAAMQQDISLKMRDLVERDYKRLMIYAGSETLSQYSAFWRTFIRPRVEKKLYGSQEFPERKHVRRTVDAYATNVRMTVGLCRHLNIRCHFFLQPLVVTKSPLTPLEQATIDSLEKDLIDFVREFYASAAETLKGENGFHDVSHILDREEGPHFFDLGHTSPFSGVPIGRALARYILHANAPAAPDPSLRRIR